ncbi:hypothetical protein [Pseudomonas fontis]|uniref:Tail fiber protein n=1 Tax=Pseudomonas fontis TaxID=2942633 RepID=A0ABT5NMI4_9PSED|nr:hypothetical protein [Pseudomonas fontis]MDD0974879.1 hypothetical protein [Pseudomonas fontis]MDD0989320.1 hypothetical protein [Pseudomonas fontis]
MTDQTQRLEIATVRAEIGSNITFRFNNDAIDAGGIPTESGDIKNLKLIIKEIEDKASVSTTIYPTVSAGLAATPEGGMFLVASSEEDEIYVVWRKVGGVAVDTGKRTLSSQAVETATEAAQASADESAASATTAQAAATAAVAQFQSLTSTAENEGAAIVGNAYKVINASQYGCADGEDVALSLQLASDDADARGWPLALDFKNGTLSVPVALPQRVIGLGCELEGDLTWTARKYASGSEFKCTNLLFDGFWNPDIKGIEVSNILTFRGFIPDFGGFYSVFQSFRAGQIVLDASKQAINGNTFIGMNGNKAGGPGILITTYGQPPSGGVQEAHGNLFIGADTSHSTGLRNDIVGNNQTNFILGGYCELGALPLGDWHIGVAGMHIDGSSLPVLQHHNHCLGMTHHSPATAGDSISASPVNACVGGDWSVIGVNNAPPCFESSYAATLSARAETPYGYTAVWGGAATGANQYLQCRFSTPTGRFSGTFILECPNGLLPYAIEVSDGITTSNRQANAAANLGNGFFLFRVSGAVQKNTQSVVRFFVTAPDGMNRQISLGAAFVTPLKAAFMPTFTEPASCITSFSGGREHKVGTVTQPLVNTAGVQLVTITYPQPFRNFLVGSPTFTFQPDAGYQGAYLRHELVSADQFSAVVRFYYSTAWAGKILWTSTSQ